VKPDGCLGQSAGFFTFHRFLWSLMVSHPRTRPEALRVTHRPQQPHRRGTTAPSPSISTMKRPTFSSLATAQRLSNSSSLSPRPELSTHPQGHLSQRRVLNAPLPLRPGPFGWGHHLADPVYHVSCGVHRPAPLCLALSLQMQLEVARDALLATQGGRSLEWCTVVYQVAHLGAADNVPRLLPSRRSEVNQSIIRSRKPFSRPHPARLACL
jgi:hypothetical protein